MSTAPVFEGSDGRFVSTQLAPRAVGPERAPRRRPGRLACPRLRSDYPAAEGLGLARVTYEFMRPVPVGPLEVHAEVVRGGRRVQLLEGSILVDGVEVVRARALQVRGGRCRRRRRREHPAAPGARAWATVRAACPAPPDVRLRRDRDPVRGRPVGKRSVHGVVPAAEPDRGRRDPVAASATRCGRRLRQRHQRHAVLGRLPVHQPRPDAVYRARAGRGVDLPRVADPDRRATASGWRRASSTTSAAGSGGRPRPCWSRRANPAVSVQPVFEVLDGGFVATALASGPWDPSAQIGGAPAALLMRAFERLPASQGLTASHGPPTTSCGRRRSARSTYTPRSPVRAAACSCSRDRCSPAASR